MPDTYWNSLFYTPQWAAWIKAEYEWQYRVWQAQAAMLKATGTTAG